MNATFQLDTLTTLVIGECAALNIWRGPTGPNMPPEVTIGIVTRQPEIEDFHPAVRDEVRAQLAGVDAAVEAIAGAEERDRQRMMRQQARQPNLVVVHLPASQARAIASVLLSAATEARR